MLLKLVNDMLQSISTAAFTLSNDISQAMPVIGGPFCGFANNIASGAANAMMGVMGEVQERTVAALRKDDHFNMMPPEKHNLELMPKWLTELIQVEYYAQFNTSQWESDHQQPSLYRWPLFEHNGIEVFLQVHVSHGKLSYSNSAAPYVIIAKLPVYGDEITLSPTIFTSYVTDRIVDIIKDSLKASPPELSKERYMGEIVSYLEYAEVDILKEDIEPFSSRSSVPMYRSHFDDLLEGRIPSGRVTERDNPVRFTHGWPDDSEYLAITLPKSPFINGVKVAQLYDSSTPMLFKLDAKSKRWECTVPLEKINVYQLMAYHQKHIQQVTQVDPENPM